MIIAEGSVVLRVVSDRFSATDDSEDILKVAGFPVLARIPTGSDAQTLEAFRWLLLYCGAEQRTVVWRAVPTPRCDRLHRPPAA